VAEVVCWEVEPLERRRRGVDERMRLAFPRLGNALSRSAMRRQAGAPMRRAALTRAVRVGWAAVNRGDYAMTQASYHPDVEFHPPSLGREAIDFDPVYRGPDGVVRFIQQWKSGFERFVYEPREIADAGGERFAVRLGMIVSMPGSTVEIRDEYGTVITLRDGLVFRQYNFTDWETARAALTAGDEAAVAAAAAR
jgi:ketosteroid isomerase-like protein